MRHMAWLDATPTKGKTSRRELFVSKGGSPLLSMPEVDYAGYLLGFVFEVGLFSHGGMSAAPLTWTEILSWSTLVGVHLSRWEARTIMQLSSTYVSALHESKDDDAPAPFSQQEFDRAEVSSKIGDMLRTLASRKR